jgi:hypothetical protein
LPPTGVLALAIVTALAVAAFATDHLRVAARASAPSAVDATLAVPAVPAAVVRLLSLGFQSAAADASYLGAIQIFGDAQYTRAPEADRRRMSEALARLLEFATDLDPAFAYAYVFGAVAIPFARADASLANVPFALRLLDKGVPAVPGDWRIPFYAGYLRSVLGEDLAGAAADIAEASRRPKHPTYLPLLATRLAAQSGAVETGVALARTMLDNAETDEQRADLEERLRLLQMEQALRAIENASDRFLRRTGTLPPSLAALVTSGELPEVPAEPHGGRYELDPATGNARSTAAERLRLFDSDRRRRERDAARADTAPPSPPSPQDSPP